MKPLVLTVYPLDPAFPAGYKLPRDSRVTFRAANRMAVEKRLTLAECAAEYWRAMSDEATIVEGYQWSEMCGGWQSTETETCQRTITLHRFAQLPHTNHIEETP